MKASGGTQISPCVEAAVVGEFPCVYGCGEEGDEEGGYPRARLSYRSVWEMNVLALEFKWKKFWQMKKVGPGGTSEAASTTDPFSTRNQWRAVTPKTLLSCRRGTNYWWGLSMAARAQTLQWVPTIMSCSDFAEGCHAQTPVLLMEVDVAGSAEENGYFCAATVTQLNSCFCALTATKGSPAWLMSERAVNNEICMRCCNAQIRSSTSFNFFW